MSTWKFLRDGIGCREIFLASLPFFASCAGGGGGSSNPASSSIEMPPFTLEMTPTLLNLAQGDTAMSLLTVRPQNGFAGTISVSMESAPEGVLLSGVAFEVASDALAVSQPLVFQATHEAPLGVAKGKIVASAGSSVVTMDFDLTVEPPPPPPAPTFLLALSPTAAMAPQASVTSTTLTVTPLHGFQGNVTVSLESAPPGVTIEELPLAAFVDNAFPQWLTIAVEPHAPIGDHPIELKVASDSEIKTEIFTLIVLDGSPGTPQLQLSFGIKALQFSWSPVSAAHHYKFWGRSGPGESYEQIGDDLPASTTNFELAVALYEHMTSGFKLQACNDLGCIDSNEIDVAEGLQAAIGYFKASNVHTGDHFGQIVALSGDGSAMALGAPDEDSGSLNSGAVYLFARDGSNWTQQALLKASNAEKDDRFGISLSLSADGSTLAVGATGEDSAATGIDGNPDDNAASNSGAVYLFSRDGSSWSQRAYLKASNTGGGDAFGTSTALDANGQTLAVGASLEDSAATNSGAIYLFTRSGETWIQQSHLKASNPGSGDHFGSSASLSADGNTLAVGAPEEDGGSLNSGAVYLFTRMDAIWNEQAYVKASNAEDSISFGYGVSLAGNGNTLAVGAPGEDSGSGAVYLFTQAATVWNQDAHVKASNAEAGDRFGSALSLSADGNTLAVGAFEEDSSATGLGGMESDNSALNSGAAYLFVRDGTVWSLLSYIKAPNTDADDRFGFSVSLSGSGDTLAVGAHFEDSNAAGIGGDPNNNGAQNAGAGYLY